MQVQINQTLSTGLTDCLSSDGHVLGFILGALDKGFTVTLPGAAVAKHHKLRLMSHTHGQHRQIFFMLNGQKVHEMDLVSFDWTNVLVCRGCFYYDQQFICKTQ